MNQLAEEDFTALCATPAVREQIDSIESNRKAALVKFWSYLLGGIALALAAIWTLTASGWETASWIVAFILFITGIIAAIYHLSRVSEALKHPVLETLAPRAGLEYLAGNFNPPCYAEAQPVLFGGLSSETFSDLFYGADSEGRGIAVYEACLQRRVGKNTHTVFSGQVYALQRTGGSGEAVTAIIPDKGFLNFFKPARGMERVKVEADPEFEKKFEIYSTDPLAAKGLLFDSELRRRLLELRQAGRVHVYVGPAEALVAVSGKDRFEPGSMFRSRPGEERVRLMFDDLCASLAVLKGLKERLAP
jgi:hypothetical protein